METPSFDAARIADALVSIDQKLLRIADALDKLAEIARVEHQNKLQPPHGPFSIVP